ncbi:MAG TPA: class I SAM-dependent rRNA methyltransferase [Polyangiaceae bacterium]|nr:class I SAM-dependent rRNA methyltransferase [Polyangiaceae bacterium]
MPSSTPDLDVEDLDVRLRAAYARRGRVRAVTTAYRLVDDAADGFPGVTVDCYEKWAVVSVYEANHAPLVGPLARALVPAYASGVYAKHHERGDLRRKGREYVAPVTPVAGAAAPAELLVEENGVRWAVALHDGLSTGLFLDQRDNRRRVRAFASGTRVLNLFSYTCSFSVAAALGGAVETVSVDLSNRALERGRENLARNDVAASGHRFIREDALVYLGRAIRRGERFQLVVLDPPSFGTRGKKTFSVERDYADLARSAMTVLAEGGRLLAVTNHRKTSPARLRALLEDAARNAGRRITTLSDLPPPDDFPHRVEGVPSTKSVLVTLT